MAAGYNEDRQRWYQEQARDPNSPTSVAASRLRVAEANARQISALKAQLRDQQYNSNRSYTPSKSSNNSSGCAVIIVACGFLFVALSSLLDKII